MRSVLGLSVVGLIMGACAVTAKADLLHRYDFSADGSDSVGSASGTLVGSATVTGGALVTNGGNGTVDGKWGGAGPMMTLDPSAVAGITGAFTIEDWFSATTGWPKYDTLYAFSDTTNANYILGAPVRGYSPWPSGVGLIGGGGTTRANAGVWDYVLSGIYLDTPGPHQTVLTYDGTTFSYYVDGALANFSGLSATLVDPGFNLSTLTAIGINGGSPYDDPSLTGSTYDFRIYGGALSADQVASLDSLGSDASNAAIGQIVTPEPASLGILAVGASALISRRRRV
ncbi:MAG TPA: LamG-like jellyroll fold domain-containing protein [Phycisphaerae bacterium]|nr:LamG-like jellyroll fold domain-containing protein [Phycisphaerae bacterium]